MRYLFIIGVLFFVSCKQNLSEKYYKSTDEYTGGFNEFSLYLHSDGKLNLTIKTSVSLVQNDAGTEWESREKIVTGKWFLKDETINYSFDEPRLTIDSILINAGFNFSNKSILTFSHKLDTAYILGIPSILTDIPK